jgi:hypothetical protein
MRNYPSIGVQIPQVLLPSSGIDLQKWAVIAVDQYTSQPEYWENVEKFVGDAYSTFHIVLPEVYLDGEDVEFRIRSIQQRMKDYLAQNVFNSYENFIYVERSIEGKRRKGLVVALDLENYDYRPGSDTLIRASEATIVERIPPRLKIRNGAVLESPHVLILIDDPGRTVIEPIANQKVHLNKLYDFDLMMDSGHLTGYALQSSELESRVVNALGNLAQQSSFSSKYDLPDETKMLLYAVGDGNHSMATAKAWWEQIKSKVGFDHPARYILVEIENIYDEGLEFEPIHRVLFNIEEDIFHALGEYFGDNLKVHKCNGQEEMMREVKMFVNDDHIHRVGIITPSSVSIMDVSNPTANLPVATLQSFLDDFMKRRKAQKIDYVHGDDVVYKLSNKANNIGFYVPAMRKSDLFKTVIMDGNLPRKTFSMGHAKEKRFYMECRKIG